jgi:hypothetical protein
LQATMFAAPGTDVNTVIVDAAVINGERAPILLSGEQGLWRPSRAAVAPAAGAVVSSRSSPASSPEPGGIAEPVPELRAKQSRPLLVSADEHVVASQP